jgi:hypothetical protein
MFRPSYFPVTWKFAQIVMLPKPGKPANEASSYRPVSLLPIPSKVFEKLLLNRVRNDTDILDTTPDYQFGFREHSTIQQTHRIVNKIAASLEENQYCTAAFLDIAQAFDKVWHTGLLYKLKNKLPSTYSASDIIYFRKIFPSQIPQCLLKIQTSKIRSTTRKCARPIVIPTVNGRFANNQQHYNSNSCR